MPTIADIKKQYPDFGALDDNQIVDAVHQSFYSDLSREEVAGALGVKEAKAKNTSGPIGDLGRSLLHGVESLPGMVAGLADVVPALSFNARPFTSMSDAAGEATGFQPGKWAQDKSGYSQGYQDSQGNVNAAWESSDAVQKDQAASKMDYAMQLIKDSPKLAAAYLKNPMYTINQVVESLPAMAAGGVASRGIMTAGRVAGVGLSAEAVAAGAAGPVRNALPGYLERALPNTASEVAGGAGEGLAQTGSAMDQSKGPDQRRNALAALGSGVTDALIATGAGHAAHKLGLETSGTAMAQVGDGTAGSGMGLTRRVLQGGALEAIPQELPQSMQEAMFQNYADDKPLMEGVARQGVEGAISGFAMGGAANAISGGNHQPSAEPPPIAPPAPLQIGNTPDPMLLFPDGTVARRSEVDAYIGSLPPEQQAAMRAKMMGMAPQPATPPGPMQRAAQLITPSNFSAAPAAASMEGSGYAGTQSNGSGFSLDAMPSSAASPAAMIDQNELNSLVESERRDQQVMRAQLDQERQKQAEIDAAFSAKPELDATTAAVNQAATVDAPNAMQAAFNKLNEQAAPQEQVVPAAPAKEPRIVARTPDMNPMPLELAELQVSMAGGEVARVQNANGKFGYVVVPKATAKVTASNVKTATGTQAGDVLNKQGNPFTNLFAAKTEASKQGVGFEPVKLREGAFVVRPVAPSGNSPTSDQIAVTPAPVTQPAQPVMGEGAGGSQPTQVAPFTKPEPTQGNASVTTPNQTIQGQAQQQAPERAAGEQVSDHIGQGNKPLTEGGKPFKTKLAATLARKQQPMMRVVKSGKGFALAPKTEKQIAAQEAAARRLSIARTGTAGVPTAAHEFIAGEGGMDASTKNEFGFGNNPRVGNRTLFSGARGGMSLDTATEKLIEAGYLPEGATHSDTVALVNRSFTVPQHTADGTEVLAEAAMNQHFDDYLTAQEEAAQDDAFDPFDSVSDMGFTLDDADWAGYDALEDPIKLEVDALLAQADALGIDTDTIKEGAHENTRNGSEQDYYEATRDALTSAIEASNRSGNQDAGAQGNAGSEQGLTAPTRAEVLAQQERTDSATRAETAQRKAQELADKRDRERKDIARASEAAADTFVLGGDAEQNLSGQGSIFDEPAKPEAPTEFTHNGTRIYPTQIAGRDGAPPSSRWAVESEDNKQRRESGDRNRGGDSLHETVDAAKKSADFEAKRDAQEKERKTKAAAKEKADSDAAQAKRDANKGKSLTQIKGENFLKGDVRETSSGDVISREEWVKRRIAEGDEPSVQMIDKIKPLSRAAFNRASNQEQAAHDKKIKDGGKVPEYSIGNYVVTKTEYDHAQTLMAKPEHASKTETTAKPAAKLITELTFDQWAKQEYEQGDYKAAYLEAFEGDEKRAALGSVIGTTDNDTKTPELLKLAKQEYIGKLLDRPREAVLSLDVWDSLAPAQKIEAQRNFYDLDGRITTRLQENASAQYAEQKKAKQPYQDALDEVQAEIKRLDGISGPDTAKVNTLRARRDRLTNAIFDIGQGKAPDGRLLKPQATEAATFSIDPLEWNASMLSGAYSMAQLNTLYEEVKSQFSNETVGGSPVDGTGMATKDRLNEAGMKMEAALKKAIGIVYEKSKQTKPADQATAILDAANVTGKERIDALKDVKKGDITPDELKAAYPAKESDSNAAKPIKVGDTLRKDGFDYTVVDAYDNIVDAERVVDSGNGVTRKAGITMSAMEAVGARKAAQEAKLDALGDAPAFARAKAETPIRNLVTLHNMSSENLLHSASLGGIPVPSIGITKVDSPFGGFGDITLIAPKSMIDPSNGTPVYDRDAYTARHPVMNFKKVKSAKADAFYAKFKAGVSDVGSEGSNFMNQLWQGMTGSSASPDTVWREFQRYDAPRLMYAREVLGKTVKVPMRPVPVDFPWVTDKQFSKVFSALSDKLSNLPSSEVESSPEMAELSIAARGAIERLVDKGSPEANQSLRDDLLESMGVNWGNSGKWVTNPEIPMPWKLLDKLHASTRDAGKTEVDRAELRKRLDKLVSRDSEAYADWAMGLIKPLFDAPTITLRGKEVEPNLRNVVDAMTIGATAGAEKTMTSGAGKTAALLGKRFKSLTEIQAARDQVVPESVESEGKKSTDALLESYRSRALTFYTERDWRGQVDTWGGMDAAMDALAVAGKGALTDGNIRMSMQRKGFKGIDATTIEMARQAIDAIRNTATNYFEAKPQRAVKLNEFHGAVVPKGTSQEVLDVLATNGIEVATYNKKDAESKNKALEKLARKIDKVHGDVLFARNNAADPTGLPSSQVTSIVKAIKSKWRNSPEIIVAENMDDPLIPQSVRDFDKKQKSLGAQGEPEGFVHGGKVYLLSEQLPAQADVIRVLLHESVGHMGLHGVFGDSLKPILQQIATMRRGDVAAKAKQYGMDMSKEADRLTAAEEVLAEMAEKHPELGFVKRAIAAIRNWLRDNVPGFSSMKLTDEDIIQQYLLPARDFVVNGAPKAGKSNPMLESIAKRESNLLDLLACLA